MGKVLSIVSNPFKNFNVESRAHKIISQTTPRPSPKYKSDQLDIERLMRDYPEAYEESLRKNAKLDQHLKDVYVTSRDANLNVKQKVNPDRPLPADRTTVGPFLFGVKEPEKVPSGKTTLGIALEFITKHQNEPRTYTPNKIAKDLTIPEETIKNVLRYFRVFELYIPEDRHTKAKFAGPSIPKIEVIRQFKKELPSGEDKEGKT